MEKQIIEKLGPKRHTQKTGDISESAVIHRLLQCGYGTRNIAVNAIKKQPGEKCAAGKGL
ncbi:MAG TPA: hypothetical protein VKR42_09695 [Ktedonobacteraceae bacterium]|nr:hypothetical protein [Ktedonobacteraceae bacterium]